MFELFETIAINNGQAKNLAYHQRRYEQSLDTFYPNQRVKKWSLASIIEAYLAHHVSNNDLKGLVRCRIDYNACDFSIACFAYVKRQVTTFEPVVCDDIDYSLKFADREIFAKLLKKKQSADDIMIIKNGCITDCTIGNLVFKQQGEWFTSDTPLLYGTQRAKLLDEKKIVERQILLKDIDKYEDIRLINALNDLD